MEKPDRRAAPAASKLPVLIRLTIPHGFQTPWGGQRYWAEGEITGYPHEIKMLIERGALFDVIE